MAPRISVEIVGDVSKLNRAFSEAAASSRKLSIGIGTLVKSAVVFDIVNKALEGLNETIHLGIEEFTHHAKIQAQTQAAIESTGAIAAVSAKQIGDLALQLSNLSGIDNEAIQQAENLLLSFKNIRNEAGKGNDVFNQATKAVVDFSVRTGKDASTAAVILGRALEDPARRVASLSRAGIVFTAQQTKQLQAIQKTQGVLAAQKVLLRELEERFGGAAEAAGKTLPVQLAILRERFKDLAGEGIGLVAPALSRAVVGLTDFVRRLSEVRGFRAKLNIVFTGYRDLARDVVARIRQQFDAIDWKSVADAINKGLTRGIRNFRDAIARVDWQKVGNNLTAGLIRGVEAIHWSAVAKQIAIFMAKALIAANQLFIGVGQAIADAVTKGIEHGLQALERLAIRIAIAILKPFNVKVLGHSFFPGLNDAIDSLEQKLKDLQGTAQQTGQIVGKAIGQRSFSVAVPTTLPFQPLGGGTGGAGGLTAAQRASQRNRWFDAGISRLLDRVQDVSTIRGQITALQKIASLIQQRIAVTKDITRRLNLEDQLLQVNRQIAADRQGLAQQFVQALQLRLQRAQLTSRLSDDVSALQAIERSLKAQLALDRTNLDLQSQLLDVEQQLTALRLQQRNARQFRALGLGPTGENLTPGVKRLRLELGRISDAVKGTFLDTNKTRSLLTTIRKLLAGGLGQLSQDVRAKIQDLLSSIDNQLRQHQGQLTKFHVVDTDQVLAGLGLSPDQIRAARQRLAQLGPGNTAPTRGAGAFGIGFPSSDVVVHTTVNLDGKKVASSVTRHQQRRARVSAAQRRGRHAGVGFGLA